MILVARLAIPREKPSGKRKQRSPAIGFISNFAFVFLIISKVINHFRKVDLSIPINRGSMILIARLAIPREKPNGKCETTFSRDNLRSEPRVYLYEHFQRNKSLSHRSHRIISFSRSDKHPSVDIVAYTWPQRQILELNFELPTEKFLRPSF